SGETTSLTPFPTPYPPSSIRNLLFPVRLHKLHANRLSVRVNDVGLSGTAIGHDHRLGRIDCAAGYRGRDIGRVSDENELARSRRAELERTRLGIDRQRDARVVAIDPR